MSYGEEKRLYDVVVFGSTGYTGKFVAEELYRIQCEVRRSLRWAAAGRNAEKVRSCLQGKRNCARGRCSSLPLSLSPIASGIEDVEVVVADVGDDASLEEMCEKASVIINCVGPVSTKAIPYLIHNGKIMLLL